MKRILIALSLLIASNSFAYEVGRFTQTGTAAVVVSSVTAGGTPNQMAARNCLTSMDLSTNSGLTCSMEIDDGTNKIFQIDLSSNTISFQKTWPVIGLPGAAASYGPCSSRGQALTIGPGTSGCSAFKINVTGTIEQ